MSFFTSRDKARCISLSETRASELMKNELLKYTRGLYKNEQDTLGFLLHQSKKLFLLDKDSIFVYNRQIENAIFRTGMK